MSFSSSHRLRSAVGWRNLLFFTVALGLAAGGLLVALGRRPGAEAVWAVSTALVFVPTALIAARALSRRSTGVDLIAVLAMAGALLLGEYLAGAVISLMLTGGTALERLAVSRARRELAALLQRAPRFAHRLGDGGVVTIGVDEVRVRDRLLVKPGEVVPADGILLSPAGLLDEAALTGESRPVHVQAGTLVRSGGTNAAAPFEVRVTAPVAESTYSGIIRLVRAAERSKGPLVRLADRHALAFVAVTLAFTAITWAFSGDALRALAVLVVATPCPMILAAPAAIIGGVSRAARHGIIVKGGAPLETLARASIMLLDKTGTVTTSRPQLIATETFTGVSPEQLLTLAAAIEQMSVHPFAPAILSAAQDAALALGFPAAVHEEMGRGIEGMVDSHKVAVGQLAFVAGGHANLAAVRAIATRTAVEGSSAVYVAIDGQLSGALILQDSIRPEAPRTLRAIRKAGIRRIHMVTGDHPDVAELVADVVGIDRVFTDRTPADKAEVVKQLKREGVTVMVGDGINDAPALALADVGIAIGARGATAASEAADVVLTADRLQGLPIALRIAKRTRRIALQSIFVGMGLSFAAMGLASAGFIAPVVGAVVQEGIDVLVILNALRALGGRRLTPPPSPASLALAHELGRAHAELRPHIGELATIATRLDSMPPGEAKTNVERMRDMLVQQVLPHEREEQETAFPFIAHLLENEDPSGPLIQTHQEIHRLVRLFSRTVDRLPPQGPAPTDLHDLRRALYGLHAVLSLHIAQEDELYSMLTP